MLSIEDMKFVRGFSVLRATDTLIAGGKGASLGEMTNAGLPIPPGFVVAADAFDRFLNETGLQVEIEAILDTVNIKEMHTVEHASERIHGLIISKEMPDDIKKEIEKGFSKLHCRYVAVRSSATAEDSLAAAWAGQLESYLNTTRDTLLENVRKCWASLYSPRAIFYRFEKGMQKDKIAVAVVVQKMVDSIVAGIAFSVHPVTQDRKQMIIEAGYGLGESVVSGQITPDSYVVLKDTWKIEEKSVSDQEKGMYRGGGGNEWRAVGKGQKLSDKQIVELSKILVKIEDHYGFPVDVEWALEDGKFYIVQSRPITTLSKVADAEKGIVRVLKDSKGTTGSGGGDPELEAFIQSLKDAGEWIRVVERDICFLVRDLILEGEI